MGLPNIAGSAYFETHYPGRGLLRLGRFGRILARSPRVC